MTNTFTQSPLFGNFFADPKTAQAFSAEAFLAGMIAFETAWTQTLIDCGVVDEVTGKQAIEVLGSTRIDLDKMGAGNVDGLPVPELIRQLRKGQPKEVAAAIHTGATSQDVIDTVLMMTCRAEMQRFISAIDRCLKRLKDLDTQFGDQALMGRTRMQAALPIKVRNRLNGWIAPLTTCRTKLDDLVASVCPLQFGGPVGLRQIDGVEGDQFAARLAQRLGMTNAACWHTDRTPVLTIGHWLTVLTGALGKIGQDITLMAQQGIDEITIAGGGGSSAMPHKKNPVRAEALVTLARFNAAQNGLLGQAMIHEQERSGMAWALEWLTLPAMFEASSAALVNAEILLQSITSMGSGSI